MKNILLTVSAILFCFHFVTAQKASDVLENGIRVKPGKKIFLKYTNKKMKFDVTKSLNDPTNPADFTTLSDSAIFMTVKEGVNVYLRPLNPLNFSYNSKSELIIDPINEEASNALGLIFKIFDDNLPTKTDTSRDKNTEQIETLKKCEKFERLQSDIEIIHKKIKDSKKKEINIIFNELKALDFIDEEITKNELVKIKASIKAIDDHFKEVKALTDEARKEVKKYDCDFPESFTAQYIFNAILKDIASTTAEQKKRLENLKKSYKLVKDAQITASKGGGSVGLEWCYDLGEISVEKRKLSINELTIKESGYKLSSKKEIVSIESKDVLSKSFKVRRFQKFVPEVSVGTAYTFLKYKTYGTTSDETGQQFVAEPTENTLKNLKISTMLNFNLYAPNTPVHFLYQLGVGINSEIPTLLTGFGIRSNIDGIKRIAISAGLAMSWRKELQTLSVGDEITGTSDIDNDFKYSSSPKFTPYVALQYNF